MVNEVGLDEKVVELRDTNYLNSSNNQNNGAKKDKVTPQKSCLTAESKSSSNNARLNPIIRFVFCGTSSSAK